jgi:hypothetical protein
VAVEEGQIALLTKQLHQEGLAEEQVQEEAQEQAQLVHLEIKEDIVLSKGTVEAVTQIVALSGAEEEGEVLVL